MILPLDIERKAGFGVGFWAEYPLKIDTSYSTCNDVCANSLGNLSSYSPSNGIHLSTSKSELVLFSFLRIMVLTSYHFFAACPKNEV